MTDKMSVEQEEVRDTALGFLNGCGAGAVLWVLIIAGVRAWA